MMLCLGWNSHKILKYVILMRDFAYHVGTPGQLSDKSNPHIQVLTLLQYKVQY